MKYLLLVLLFATAAALSTRAQDLKAESPADSRQITRLEDDWVAAVQKSKADVIEAALTDDFTLVGPTGHVSPKDEFVAQVRDGALVIEAAKLDGVEVRVYGNAAVAVGVLAISKGHLMDRDMAGDYRFTDTFVKRDGKWLRAAQQFTVVK